MLDQSVNHPGRLPDTFGSALDSFYAASPKASRDPSTWTPERRAPRRHEATVLRLGGAPGDDTGTAAVPAVVRIAPPPGFAMIEGLASRRDGMGGWVRDHPATLEIAPNAGIEDAEPQVRLVTPGR